MTEPQTYIQHPKSVALEILSAPAKCQTDELMPLGLICNQPQDHSIGSLVVLKHPALPEDQPIEATVVWCRRQKSGYQIALGFLTEEELYRVRMLEQLCHIQLYQKEMKQEGRKLSAEGAAVEWITKYAAHFPTDGL